MPVPCQTFHNHCSLKTSQERHKYGFFQIDEVSASYQEIKENADEKGALRFEQVDLEVMFESAEAARYLVDLLLGK